ncbi:procollagen-lysine,2-oxoglutarate 5-dioxygenase [Galendromus occidentalis]|uniref:Procollagen-lysine,2-oxoglutarate 5-dioxygenase n=1 Tax=Galendromus occidentalis TaxID=34638 RepID=A0AAJ7SGJ9_9ACAR|nr:procollagen-lysine,2-oxoglutarate 5-dioxygenase [Galendromus occidentalis]
MFVDSYDVIFTGNKQDILEKFFALDADAVFSAEGFCWPDASLENKYPESDGKKYLNSGGFVGFAPAIHKIATHVAIQDEDDDQLFYTKIYLDPSLRESLRIRLDNKSTIFQNLNGAVGDVSISEDAYPKVKNTAYGTEPIVIHGNGPSKVALNSLANYLAGAWKNGEGCLVCEDRITLGTDTVSTRMPQVTVGIFIEEATPFFDEFLDHFIELDYPKEKISLFIHRGVDYHNERLRQFVENGAASYAKLEMTSTDDLLEWKARERALEVCLLDACDFYLNLDSRVHLTNRKVLQHLIAKDRNFIAPLVMRTGQAWSNFWGALTSEGFYARSHDYMEIVKGEKKGIWNVPYIGEVYLIKASVFSKKPLSYVNGALDPDMALCKNLRERGIFMYVDNMEDFGFLINSEHFDTSKKHPDFYEIYNNQFAWALRYIHKEYKDIFSNHTGVLRQPCHDVFWFPLASPTFCTHLIEIMENHGGWSDGTNSDPRLAGGYENVPTRDIHMKQVGLEPQWLFFLREYVRPVQEHVFTGYYHDPPKAIMNFVVRYRPDEQPSLKPHHDASTYTLNLALNQAGKDFTGGGSHFIRQNCSVTSSPSGWGLLHPGRLTHYHEGLTTTSGTRYIMVSFVDP